MNRFLMMLMLFGGLRENAVDGAGAGGGAGTGDAGAGAAAAAATGAGAASTGGGAAAATGTVTDPAAAVTATSATTDPNDPMAALDAALAAMDGSADPAKQQAGQAAAVDAAAEIPAQFQEALKISPFVTSPEAVQTAVRAADEVWKVASGQLPARSLIEGMRESNPQQYSAIVNDLASYISEVTGQQFGGAPQQAGPLDGLKQANPQAYQQVADLFQQLTGSPLDGPADPRDARLAALEQRYAAEENQRQVQAVQQQVTMAREKAMTYLGTLTKGTYAEGSEQFMFQQCASRVGVSPQQMTEMLLKGDTSKLEAAYKETQKELSGIFKGWAAGLIKKSRGLQAAVPAAAAQTSKTAGSGKEMPIVPGESLIQRAERAQREGWLE
jgi:hypothetical protein